MVTEMIRTMTTPYVNYPTYHNLYPSDKTNIVVYGIDIIASRLRAWIS